VPFRLLRPDEVETIEALGETIVPGARAAGIAHFIDQQLSVPLEEALLETRSPATITSAKAMTPAIDEPQLERDPHLPLHYFDRRRSRLQRSGSHKTRRWRRQSRANSSLKCQFPGYWEKYREFRSDSDAIAYKRQPIHGLTT